MFSKHNRNLPDHIGIIILYTEQEFDEALRYNLHKQKSREEQAKMEQAA